MISPSSDIVALLDGWSRGDRTALQRLLPLVYTELRPLASFSTSG